MNTAPIKKTVTVASLVSVGVSVLLGILLLLRAVPANRVIGDVYLTLLTVFLTGLFLLNALDAIHEKNVFGYVCFALLVVTAMLFLVNIWVPLIRAEIDLELLLKINVWLAVAAILFDVIVGNVITVGPRVVALQIAEYLSFAYVLFAVALAISGNPVLLSGGLITPFAIVALIAVGTFFAMAFVKKSAREKAPAAPEAADGMITIRRSEYEALLAKIKIPEEKEGK